ncbi:MAG: DUF4335 domain-containing protein [Leptolyngbya sp. SIO3F4]|nr:DUF4335 domain-containing protein [Leptolyngbya sp. SIO3F4]
MSSVLPINTQRYESGDYTLEVTAHPSPLSQWSDRPVVRQLRFNLWVEQPERQRLAAGDQQQLVTLSDTVESYVQRHLTHAAWPSTHQLKLLDQNIKLSTLQLFHLAEVLNAYGQRQITLPVAKVKPRKRRRQWQLWWTGSAVASVLAAFGITTTYLQYRPQAFNQLETAQAPTVTSDEGAADSAIAPQTASEADLSTEILEQDDTLASRINKSPISRSTENLVRQNPLELDTFSDGATPIPEVAPTAPATAPPTDTIEQPQVATAPTPDELPAPEPSPEETKVSAAPFLITEDSLETADREELLLDESQAAAVPSSGAATTRARIPNPETVDATLSAISTEFSRFQPREATYPLVYHLQVSPNGTITAVQPISEAAPTIELSNQAIVPPPGRPLRVEMVIDRGTRPTVRELPQ